MGFGGRRERALDSMTEKEGRGVRPLIILQKMQAAAITAASGNSLIEVMDDQNMRFWFRTMS